MEWYKIEKIGTKKVIVLVQQDGTLIPFEDNSQYIDLERDCTFFANEFECNPIYTLLQAFRIATSIQTKILSCDIENVIYNHATNTKKIDLLRFTCLCRAA